MMVAKKIFMSLMVAMLPATCFCQQWQYGNMGDFSPFTNQDKGDDYVDCATGRNYDAYNAYICSKKYGIESVRHKKAITAVSGLTIKVEAGVNAGRPKGGKVSEAKSGNYNYQTSDSHKAWKAKRQAQIQAERQRIAERNRQEKIEDDARAANAEAQANHRMQGETNRRKAQDRWNATEGAQQAMRRAKSSYHGTGPRVTADNSKKSGEYRAGVLRRQNKPRRKMYTYATPRNIARQILPEVKRTPVTATQKRTSPGIASAGSSSRKKIVLSDNATSSLGKDWKTEPLTTTPIPPKKRRMTAEEVHYLKMVELVDNRPLTPAEEKYYENLTY